MIKDALKPAQLERIQARVQALDGAALARGARLSRVGGGRGVVVFADPGLARIPRNQCVRLNSRVVFSAFWQGRGITAGWNWPSGNLRDYHSTAAQSFWSTPDTPKNVVMKETSGGKVADSVPVFNSEHTVEHVGL